MRTAYDASYVPPAPTVEVWLGVPDEPLSVGPLMGLVDSGADACIVPKPLVASLGLRTVDQRFIRRFDGQRRPVDICVVDVGIVGLRLPAIEIAVDEDQREIIVGRNVLNRLVVLLDGPGQVVQIRG